MNYFTYYVLDATYFLYMSHVILVTIKSNNQSTKIIFLLKGVQAQSNDTQYLGKQYFPHERFA